MKLRYLLAALLLPSVALAQPYQSIWDGTNKVDVTAAGGFLCSQSGTWDEVGINDSGNSITVDGTVTCDAGTNLNTSALATESTLSTLNSKVTACNTGAVTVSAALPAGTNAIGKLVANSGVDIGDVDVTSSALPTGAATSAKQDTVIGHVDGIEGLIGTTNTNTGNTATAVQIMDDWDNAASDGASVSGDVAHDTADAGEPVKIGGKAVNAFPAPVSATNDRVNAHFDMYGRQLTAHIDPAMQGWRSFNATTTQTGADVWDPTLDRIAITSVVVSAYATTACRLILWVGANADTTFSEGTDQTILKASYAPTTSSKPGTVFTPAVPIYTQSDDYEVHVTTDANCSIDITVHGYEYDD